MNEGLTFWVSFIRLSLDEDDKYAMGTCNQCRLSWHGNKITSERQQLKPSSLMRLIEVITERTWKRCPALATKEYIISTLHLLIQDKYKNKDNTIRWRFACSMHLIEKKKRTAVAFLTSLFPKQKTPSRVRWWCQWTVFHLFFLHFPNKDAAWARRKKAVLKAGSRPGRWQVTEPAVDNCDWNYSKILSGCSSPLR